MLEDTVKQPALAAGQHQLQVRGYAAALLQHAERIHEAVQVLARFEDADGQDEGRVADAQVATRTL